MNLGALQGGSVKIHAPDNREVPAPGIVNGWIARAGLRPHTGGMDQLERDLLVIRARHGTLERLVERYPELPRASLEKLRRLAGGDSGGDIGSGR